MAACPVDRQDPLVAVCFLPPTPSVTARCVPLGVVVVENDVRSALAFPQKAVPTAVPYATSATAQPVPSRSPARGWPHQGLVRPPRTDASTSRAARRWPTPASTAARAMSRAVTVRPDPSATVAWRDH